MLLPLRPGELQRVIPAVATGNQFKNALGSPSKVLQRVMISAIGGVITLVISQSQVSSQFYSLWLIIGVTFLLYILWGPILEASRKNSQLRKYPSAALFDGEIIDIFTKEKIENTLEQANNIGELELIENRRTWVFLEIADEDGYLGTVSFPMDKKHQLIRIGLPIRCLVLSTKRDFSRIDAISDAWLPSLKIWVGEYPFLLRPAFEELCQMRALRRSV